MEMSHLQVNPKAQYLILSLSVPQPVISGLAGSTLAKEALVMMNQTPRILVVDDEPMNVALLEAVLVSRGYAVIPAANGLEALDLIHQDNIDLVLLDIMMPEMDGFEVCRRIKDDERLRDIPIIMLTVLHSKQDRIKGIEAGAEDFISKPFDQGEVLARIKMLLKLRETNESLRSAYRHINLLSSLGESMIQPFRPLQC